MLAFHHMVQAVTLDDPLEIVTLGHNPVPQAAVDDPIMKAEINYAITGDPGADRCGPVTPAVLAQPEQHDRRRGKDHGVQVIQFECPGSRAVMAFVQKPTRAMHNPAVHRISE